MHSRDGNGGNDGRRGVQQPTSAYPHAEPATAAEAATLLAAAAQRMGVAVEIHPGLDRDAPQLNVAGKDRYVLGAEIGSGGGGRVLLATDRNLRRSVALKVLAERHRNAAPWVQAFLEEAIITAGLEHPNIVPVYDLGWSPSVGFYYTMKRLTGQPLCNLLQDLRRGDPKAIASFGLSRALSAFVELCRAVAYSHRRGVIHCDLKPDNIVVGELGEIVLVDWGMAQLLGPAGKSQARTRMRGGTPTYMAPEQFTEDGSDLGVEVDTWALGVILYEFLTLEVPFCGENTKETGMRVMIEPLVPPSKRTPAREIPPGIERICCRALERDLSCRYPNVGELLADVEAWLAGSRERMLRKERAAQALSHAHHLLGKLEDAEINLRNTPSGLSPKSQSTHAEGKGDDHPGGMEAATQGIHSSPQASLRDELLEQYELAAKALLRGLNLDPKSADLQILAGDLYWRIFRLYPPRSGPATALGRRCINLLTQLFPRACESIVEFGRQLTATGEAPLKADSSAGYDARWLAVAQMIAD
ncbi:MAG TPA: serine/threonine protein kinase, partial [Nannocystis exedens]|nr:serine/threonine protein kinase [Nannocystis exedens]